MMDMSELCLGTSFLGGSYGLFIPIRSVVTARTSPHWNMDSLSRYSNPKLPSRATPLLFDPFGSVTFPSCLVN